MPSDFFPVLCLKVLMHTVYGAGSSSLPRSILPSSFHLRSVAVMLIGSVFARLYKFALVTCSLWYMFIATRSPRL